MSSQYKLNIHSPLYVNDYLMYMYVRIFYILYHIFRKMDVQHGLIGHFLYWINFKMFLTYGRLLSYKAYVSLGESSMRALTSSEEAINHFINLLGEIGAMPKLQKRAGKLDILEFLESSIMENVIII